MRRVVPLACAIAAGASLVGVSDASAAVAIGPTEVIVSTTGARAVVTRQPFRIAFDDGAGHVALQQVANPGAQPLPVAPTPQPAPLGFDLQKHPTLYAPLSFTVGQGRDVQYPGSEWNGAELAGTETGVQYSAQAVEDARPLGDGARLTVSTDDPSGRKLQVDVVPGPGAAISVHAVPTPSDGVATMADSFASAHDEAFRGFGGRHNAIDQHGEDFYNWIEQENFGAGELQPAVGPAPGSGGSGYLFPNGSTAAYYVQSQFVSSRGYGFLLDRNEITRWRMDSDRPDAWQVAASSQALDYVVAPGSAARAIGTLTAITGRHLLPPEWGLEPQMDRLVRFPNESAESYDASVQDDLTHLARHEIPLAAYRIEGWQFYDQAKLRALIARLHGMGIKALVYFRSFVDDSSHSGTDSDTAYDDVVNNGYAAKDATGRPYLYLSNFNAPAAVIDFTNPAAVRWWDGRLKAALDAGADGFMEDFGEQVQVDMHFANGETGATMHNRYPAVYHRVTRDFLDAYESSHPGRSFFVYVRSGYSGAPGSTAYEQSDFPGDETTDWSRSSGLASLTTDMLNRAVGGAFGFNSDIGGYFDIGPYPHTTKELFIRWAEWAALSPAFRLHGAISTGTHAPWTFDAETVKLYRAISGLRMAAVPYIYRLWREADRTGIPPTRPLWLQFPGDGEAAKQDQEWMLGDDVLVAPVVAEGETARQVYFPPGCWQAPDNGETHVGPGHATVSAPLARLPFFFRCGEEPFLPPGAPHRCVDRRKFSFRVHQPRGGRIVRVAIYVNGRRIRRFHARRIDRVTLKRMPLGTFTVKVVATSNRGARTVSVRRYRGCTKGRPHTRVRRPRRHR